MRPSWPRTSRRTTSPRRVLRQRGLLRPAVDSVGVPVTPLDDYIAKSKFDTAPFFPGYASIFFKGTDGKTSGSRRTGRTLGEWRRTASCRRHDGAGHVGAALTTAGLKKEGSRRPADLPLGPTGRGCRLPVPERGSVGRKPPSTPPSPGAANFYVGLLKSGLRRNPADRLGLVRRGARQGDGGDRVRGQLGAPVHEVDLPGRAVHDRAVDGEGQAGGNLGFTVSYSMAKDAKNKEAAWELLS